ncbi:hypothetical protein CLU97_3659 [Chryseobacterium sp. 7]|uniref:hypothetical protein n=1 Tax=Chryseobacterium sp. 7 TaxID=2035214 RepID=UPI000F122811|nr:hypothetical protein [Chryseobacterium sp. 7]RLJ34164.1 hypothetical protein CLU97_3659 [Chryseobacterium sp. 7]
MDNVFDTFKALTFDVIATTMGYDAQCRGITARVLFNHPSENEKLSEHNYDYDRPTLEFKVNDWEGIREAIERKEDVLITLRGKEYYAMKIIGDDRIAHDGDTYKVLLEEA